MLVRRKLDFGDKSEPGLGQPRHSALFACPCQFIENHLKYKPRGKFSFRKYFYLPNFPLKWTVYYSGRKLLSEKTRQPVWNFILNWIEGKEATACQHARFCNFLFETCSVPLFYKFVSRKKRKKSCCSALNAHVHLTRIRLFQIIQIHDISRC